MNWQEIRQEYPHQWVVVEAIGAFTQGAQRIIPELEVIQVLESDSHAAWQAYESYHQADRNREYYVLHTDRQQLNIGVIDAFGRVLHE